MNILLQSKSGLEQIFRQHAVIERNLLGMVLQGESAWGFHLGDLHCGTRIIAGLIQNQCRYVVFQKLAPGPWTDNDLRAFTGWIGPWGNWQSTPGLSYSEPQAPAVLGWQNPQRHYCFVYIPAIPGGIPLAPNASAIDQNFPSSGGIVKASGTDRVR